MGAAVGGIPELLDENCTFGKGSSREIARLLASLTKSVMIDQAIKNFEKSRRYDRIALSEERRRFLEEFRSACRRG